MKVTRRDLSVKTLKTVSENDISICICGKIVIRRLPPSLTKEELQEQLQPLPEVDYLEFFSNDTR